MLLLLLEDLFCALNSQNILLYPLGITRTAPTTATTATLGGPTTTGGRATDTAGPGQYTEEDSTGDELKKICDDELTKKICVCVVFCDNEFISGQSIFCEESFIIGTCFTCVSARSLTYFYGVCSTITA